MSNFSVLFCYSDGGVIYHKSAVVSASSPDVAKEKLVSCLLNLREGKPFPYFKIESVRLSSYNFLFV